MALGTKLGSTGAWSERIDVGGGRVPTMMYGTAWKEERTDACVKAAIASGFRAIDTANQRRHYFEAAVGKAVQASLASGAVSREDLFLQTKFTFLPSQDQRLPYDPNAPVATQVEQSCASSLEHLGVDALDGYLLHGPSRRDGLGPDDWEAWTAMEALQRSGRIRLLGVSNVAPGQLEDLWAKARVKPALVQNRCFTRPAADAAVRAFCRSKGIAYQGFSLLTAIPTILGSRAVAAIASRLAWTPAQVVFRYCLEEGMVVLTGPTDPKHMGEDLAIDAGRLTPDERRVVAGLVTAPM